MYISYVVFILYAWRWRVSNLKPDIMNSLTTLIWTKCFIFFPLRRLFCCLFSCCVLLKLARANGMTSITNVFLMFSRSLSHIGRLVTWFICSNVAVISAAVDSCMVSFVFLPKCILNIFIPGIRSLVNALHDPFFKSHNKMQSHIFKGHYKMGLGKQICR